MGIFYYYLIFYILEFSHLVLQVNRNKIQFKIKYIFKYIFNAFFLL